MDTMEIKNAAALHGMLDALRSVVGKIPESTRCYMYCYGIQLFHPDEGKISTAYGQEIRQAPFDDEFDERFVCVDDVKVFWLVPKETGDGPAV